jgi:DNA-binding MarR family transcriptional regulator
MDTNAPGFRPIGWWLKEADAALDEAFDAALAGDEVDRRGWQILSSLARAPVAPAELKASLDSFDPSSTVAAVLHHLRSRGWVGETEGRLHLTDAGAAKHAELAAHVDGVRAKVTAALSQEHHDQLVALLERLVEGLRAPS